MEKICSGIVNRSFNMSLWHCRSLCSVYFFVRLCS